MVKKHSQTLHYNVDCLKECVQVSNCDVRQSDREHISSNCDMRPPDRETTSSKCEVGQSERENIRSKCDLRQPDRETISSNYDIKQTYQMNTVCIPIFFYNAVTSVIIVVLERRRILCSGSGNMSMSYSFKM
jgi:hypothetical protein